MKDARKTGKAPSPPIHALEAARGRLAKLLSREIKEYDRNGTCRAGEEICRSMERFVAAIGEVPGGGEELRRRACFIEDQCGPGTEYASAKAGILGKHTQVIAAIREAVDSLCAWAEACGRQGAGASTDLGQHGGPGGADSADKIKTFPENPELVALPNAERDNRVKLEAKETSLNKLALKITKGSAKDAESLTRSRRRWLKTNSKDS